MGNKCRVIGCNSNYYEAVFNEPIMNLYLNFKQNLVLKTSAFCLPREKAGNLARHLPLC